MKFLIFGLLNFLALITAFAQTLTTAQSSEVIIASAVSDRRLRLTKRSGASFTLAEQTKLKDRDNFKISFINTVTNPADPKLQDITASLINNPELDTIIGGTRRILCNGGRIATAVACSIITIELDNPLDLSEVYVFTGLEFSDGIVKPFAVAMPVPTPAVDSANAPKATITTALGGGRDRVRVQTPEGVDRITATQTPGNPIRVKDKYFVLSPNGDRAIAKSDELTAQIYRRQDVNKIGQTLDEGDKGQEEEYQRLEESNGSPITESGPTIDLKINRKLGGGRNHDLIIDNGLTIAATNKSIKAFGTIKTVGLPQKGDDLKFEFRFSHEAAQGVKPFFDIFVKSTPKSFRVRPNMYWEPEFKIDVGFGNTKSGNSIEFKLPFRSRIFRSASERSANADNLKKCDYTQPDYHLQECEYAAKNYYNWRQIPWSDYEGSTYFYYGPKIEADRKFKRVNLLGNLQFELRLRRWRGSVGQQRAYLLSDAAPSSLSEKEANEQGALTETQINLIRLKRGFSFTPFFGFDFGGKLTNETVESEDELVQTKIPRHSILRAYSGFRNLFEWEMFSFPSSLSIEETVLYLGREEVIGDPEAKIVGIRRLRGFQHLGKLSFDLYFDQLRRYSFNITYENGRKVPDFEYLNKVTAGFKFSY